MNPELSICIPTYNRAKILAESLRALLPQCVGLPVEICVANNASTDETAIFLAGCTGIRVQTQTSNIGMDRNILAALRMATGRYVLPIGDDEVIGAGGVVSILFALRASPDMLMLHARNQGARSITDLSEAFELLWDKMPLGGFVIPRQYCEPRYTDRYLGTHHAYSGAAWDYLLRLRSVRIDCMPQAVVEFRQVPKSYAAYADIVHLRDIPRWFDLIPSAYAKAAIAAKRKYLKTCRTPRALLRFGAIWLRRHA